MLNRSLLCTIALFAAVGGASRSGAQELSLNEIAVHGYGAWSYGRTTDNLNSNMFLFGHQRGDYSHVEFALNLAAQLNDRLQIVAQPFWHAGHHANQTASGVDYGFGEWKFSDALRFRIGAVKQPFGIYTEIFDVNTLRPFGALPQGVYGPSGMVGKAYTGMGFTGVRFADNGWGIGYDVYGGGLEVAERDAALQVIAQGPDTLGKTLNLAETRTFRDVVGGRLIGYTPLDGLTFGLSAYTGTRPVSAVEHRRTVVGAHAEYVDDIWSIRSEFARETDDVNRRTIDGAYAEAAYRLTRTVQIAGMWTTQRSTMKGVNMSYASSLADHDELAAALNYWFTPNLGVKTSFHYVEGNRFSSPEPQNIRRFVANGTLNNITRVVLVGGALSF